MPSIKPTPSRVAALITLLFFLFSAYTVGFAESPALLAGDIIGQAAIVIDGRSGKVLFEKNGDAKNFPASTTKIMTLLLAIEYGNLDDQIEIPPEAANIPGDSSLVPVQIGERMTLRDLLYGFFLRSGNDGGNALAVIVAGSVNNFATLMNERAKALGCTGTNFVNPHGYHDDNHYTTAHDMALIAQEALKNAAFREIASTATYTMAKTNKREAYTINNGNQMVVPGSTHYRKAMTGVKTGYYSKAGHCFVGSAIQGTKELITVVFNSNKEGKWTDTEKMLDYGFSLYQEYSFGQLYSLSPIYVTIKDSHDDDSGGGVLMLTPVPGETDDYKELCLAEDLHDAIVDFASRMSVEYTRELAAPVLSGDIMGTLTFTQENGTELHTTLIASRDVEVAPVPFDIEEYIPVLKQVNKEMVQFVAVLIGLGIGLGFFFKIRGAIRRRQRRKAQQKRRQRAMERRG